MLLLINNFTIELNEGEHEISQRLAHLLHIQSNEIQTWNIVRKAIDARQRKNVHFVCNIEVVLDKNITELPKNVQIIEKSRLLCEKPQELSKNSAESVKNSVIVVGAGPAGLFASLALAEAGVNVILLERGKPVETRMRDIGRLRSRGELNPESNVCFGEGGAGTYTDGKLYTRIKHPFVRWVLAEFVRFGASEDILVDAHPHLGTDKLVRIVRNMRQHLIELGVNYRFETCVKNIIQHNNQAAGVLLTNGEELLADSVVLAMGHSARDTIENIHAQGITIEAKDFAVGVRAEHDQEWVNQCQFGDHSEHEALGAAEYKLTHQVNDPLLAKQGGKRGIYSFCMCPGGLILPSPTEHGLMAINGMSNAHRRSGKANSGIVVQVTATDLARHGLGNNPLGGIQLQRELEAATFNMTTTPYAAPAMRISDYVNKKATGKLADNRFKPSAEAADLWQLFPKWLSEPLREGLLAFDRKMKGYVSDEANLFAVESRTSSPIRLPREANMQSVSLAGLYPAGEGAGYAGGIVSAAVDGLKAAEKIINHSS